MLAGSAPLDQTWARNKVLASKWWHCDEDQKKCRYFANDYLFRFSIPMSYLQISCKSSYLEVVKQSWFTNVNNLFTLGDISLKNWPFWPRGFRPFLRCGPPSNGMMDPLHSPSNASTSQKNCSHPDPPARSPDCRPSRDDPLNAKLPSYARHHRDEDLQNMLPKL